VRRTFDDRSSHRRATDPDLLRSVTDVDELPDTLQPTAALEHHEPVLTRRRRSHRPFWWVLATIVLGALIGSGLAVLAGHQSGSEVASAESTTTTAASSRPSIPSGLVARDPEADTPAIHSIDNRVFVVGDSVMQGAAPYLGDLLEGWSVIADTRVGRFIDEANRVVLKRRKDVGQIAVLNLGNNYNGDEVAFAQSVDTALAGLTGVSHVIWVNTGEFEEDRAEVNEVLREAAKTHPNLTIVDWNSWWEQDDSLTSGDRVHLTPDGAQAYAALVAASVLQVTEAAGEIPAPGAKPPKLNTSGQIPSSSSSSRSSGSSGSSGSSSKSTRSSSSRSSSGRTATTVAPATPDEPVGPPVTSPPATSPPVTSPPVTTPPVATP
jgi:hypothetical protein